MHDQDLQVWLNLIAVCIKSNRNKINWLFSCVRVKPDQVLITSDFSVNWNEWLENDTLFCELIHSWVLALDFQLIS